MPLDPSADFAVALHAIEAATGVRYPPSAPQLLTELSTIAGTPQHHAIFENARLLVTEADVRAPRDEMNSPLIEGYLLPFMTDNQGEWPDVYGFDMADPTFDRIAMYSVHTIVEDWPDAARFLQWVRTFVPPSRPCI